MRGSWEGGRLLVSRAPRFFLCSLKSLGFQIRTPVGETILNSTLYLCYLGGISLSLLYRLLHVCLCVFFFCFKLHLMQSYSHVCLRQTDISLEARIVIFPFNHLLLQYK